LIMCAVSVDKSFAQQQETPDSGKVFTLKDLEEIVFFNHRGCCRSSPNK
jgi:hypothetical protein